MNEALERFAAVDERKAERVKLRYFVGLNFEEAAAALGIAVPTVRAHNLHLFMRNPAAKSM
jgi:DNA-directed RNA polymerase specialized sigma24 family protein